MNLTFSRKTPVFLNLIALVWCGVLEFHQLCAYEIFGFEFAAFEYFGCVD